MIILKNAAYSYRPNHFLEPRIPVLGAINMVVPTRGQVAVLGGAGSGKSTLLKLMCGSHPPTSGVVRRSGTVSFPLGFVGASGRVSVSQYLQFVAKCYGVDPLPFMRYVVDFAELDDVLHRPMGKLEPDRRGRLNMTIGYALPFDHYLLDSRISASDPEFRKKCLRFLEARQQTAGIVLATRKASMARQFCTSAAVMHSGTLTYFEDIDRAIEFYEEIEPNPVPRTNDVYYTPTDALGDEERADEQEQA